jgi:hypothetical protein
VNWPAVAALGSVPHMGPVHVETEIEHYRARLEQLAECVASEQRTDLYEEVRADADALICLMEEVPEPWHPGLQYLLERYENLMRSLLN